MQVPALQEVAQPHPRTCWFDSHSAITMPLDFNQSTSNTLHHPSAMSHQIETNCLCARLRDQMGKMITRIWLTVLAPRTIGNCSLCRHHSLVLPVCSDCSWIPWFDWLLKSSAVSVCAWWYNRFLICHFDMMKSWNTGVVRLWEWARIWSISILENYNVLRTHFWCWEIWFEPIFSCGA